VTDALLFNPEILETNQTLLFRIKQQVRAGVGASCACSAMPALQVPPSDLSVPGRLTRVARVYSA
jgi:hypothetical protein